MHCSAVKFCAFAAMMQEMNGQQIATPSHQSAKTSSSQLANLVMKRIKGAARKERWGRSFLQIAWTAGPVTYLGMQSGYYLAYGSPAPTASFFYFAAYTLIAGLFALVARFLYNATRGDYRNPDQAALEFVFDALPLRILEIRNLQLERLDPYGRKVLAAKYLLENPDTSTDALATAVYDILGDTELSEGFRRLEIFRRSGLLARARETRDELLPRLEPRRERLAIASETVASMLMRKASDEPIDPLYGRKRTNGFLNRVYASGDKDDINLMTLADAEEVCILVFELINGRAFPLYRVEYRGNARYVQAARALQKAQREYRAAIYRRNSAIRIIAEQLYRPTANRSGSFTDGKRLKRRGAGIKRILASIPEIRSARILQDRIVEAMKEFMANEPKHSPRYRQIATLYKRLHRSGITAQQSYQRFRNSWQNLDNHLDDPNSKNAMRIPLLQKNTGSGIAIIPSKITLSDRTILPLARRIHEKLQEFDSEHEDSEIQSNDEKELAIDLLLIADDFLPLEDTAVQQAIESTESAYVSPWGNRTQGRSGSTLISAEWGQSPGTRLLEDILRSQVLYHRLNIDDDAQEFLEKEYGLSGDFLLELREAALFQPENGFTLPEPIVVPPLEHLEAQG